jgi:ABC-type dipeptide/oligopeptide/nickel transport system permease subunit
MGFYEAIQAATFVGTKHEAEDIVDFIAVRASLLTSLLTGVVLAIWLGMALGPLAGVLIGIASYAISMRACALMFFPRHGRHKSA